MLLAESCPRLFGIHKLCISTSLGRPDLLAYHLAQGLVIYGLWNFLPGIQLRLLPVAKQCSKGHPGGPCSVSDQGSMQLGGGLPTGTMQPGEVVAEVAALGVLAHLGRPKPGRFVALMHNLVDT